MKTRVFFLAGLLTCVACTNDEDYEQLPVDNGTSLCVEVETESDKMTTRANYTGFPATAFEEGDAIGIYAFNGSSYVNSNVKFTRQSDGSWTPSGTVIYNPDYTYYAYFPYIASPYTPVTSGTVDDVDTKFAKFISDASSKFWKTDQSTKEKFTASNLMIAKGTVTGARTVKFTLQHKRGLAVIGASTNKWYYKGAPGVKYSASLVYSGNIPYQMGETRYFLMKPSTNTSLGGLTLRAAAGKYKYMVGGELIGTPTLTYATSTNNGASFGSYSSTKPTWMPTLNIVAAEGEPTEFEVEVTNSTSTSVSLGKVTEDNLGVDAALQSAAPVVGVVDLSMVNNDGTAREDGRTTANCYLVHAPGDYKIPLVYGNAIRHGALYEKAYKSTTSSNSNKLDVLVNHNDASITAPWISKSTSGEGVDKGMGITVDGAELIWEDVKGMITDVDIDGDFLTFTVDEDKIGDGNALVAAKSGANIVWSWHIWVTSETLTNLTEVNTGSHTYNVAPVNVGQRKGRKLQSCTKYAGDHCRVKAVLNGVTVEFEVEAEDNIIGGTQYWYPSPYYQWGRKDPFVTNVGAYNASGKAIVNPTTASGGTAGWAIKNPTTHATTSIVYTSGVASGKYNLWDINQISTGAITTATGKTVYDPCPPDFCVPTGQLYNWMNSKTGTWSDQKGRMLTYNSLNIFFPASGRRGSSNGSLSYVGSVGYYWSASADNSYDGRDLYFDSSSWNWGSSIRAYGFPVRAVAEKE